MFTVEIPEQEYWDNEREIFVYSKSGSITIEHSLVSLSKWESKYHKPFLSSDKTLAETIDYVRFMTISENPDPDLYYHLTRKNIADINAYMNNSMTATWFRDDKNRSPNREIITAELIYYWMIAQQIPMECQYWHLNRLFTLIRVCGEKNKPPKKLSKGDLYRRNSSLNAARKARLNSRG